MSKKKAEIAKVDVEAAVNAIRALAEALAPLAAAMEKVAAALHPSDDRRVQRSESSVSQSSLFGYVGGQATPPTDVQVASVRAWMTSPYRATHIMLKEESDLAIALCAEILDREHEGHKSACAHDPAGWCSRG